MDALWIGLKASRSGIDLTLRTMPVQETTEKNRMEPSRVQRWAVILASATALLRRKWRP